MYGTIARMRLRPGAEPLLRAWMDSFTDPVRDHGWLSTTIFRSDGDPLEWWLVVVFASKEAYRANAESPNQDARYHRLRSCLEADPEWHDSEVALQMPE